MKRIIFISLCVSLFYTAKTNAQASCGSPKSGSILQEVTKRIDYVDGLFWSQDRLLFVNRYDPYLCHLITNGSNKCTKLEGLHDVSSIYYIKNVRHKLIIFADRKVILLHLNVTEDGESIKSYNMDTITTITTNPLYELKQSVTDNKGRTIIGANMESVDGKFKAKVYIIDADYATAVLIPEDIIVKISGIVLSSDYKYLFVADSMKNVVYKYEYNDRKGVVGKHEVVFNKTEHISMRGYISTLGINKNNQLWISLGGSGMVVLYDWKNKHFLQHVKLPASFPTSICYGGAKLDVLFIGTTKENEEYATLEPGSGAVYAISGTGTVGFQQNLLPMPKVTKKISDFKNGYYMSEADLKNMASIDESPTI